MRRVSGTFRTGAFVLGVALAAAPAATSSRAEQASVRRSGAWTLVHERSIGGKYEDFAFPDGTHGWLVNAPGDILRTTDGGASWTLQARGMGRLRSIDFLDAHRGFAGTITGVLYSTTDAGATWTNITSTLPHTAAGFCGIAHIGDEVHVVGKYTGPPDYFYSPDAGRTWRHRDLRDLAQGLVDVLFLDASVGFIGGMSPSGPRGQGPATILKTTDGGRSWRTVFTHDGGRGFAWKIFPVTASLIYAALQSQDGTYRVAKSTDSGDTWDVLTVATGRGTGPAVQGVGFLDERNGWVGGFFAGMYATTDGGRTWTHVLPDHRTINRFEKVGDAMITASSTGVLRYVR
jgi:photosystem II stability/assembly factor-like uncharacterized protein